MIGVKMGSHSGSRNRYTLHFHSEWCLNEVEFPSGQCHVARAFGFKALSGKLLSLGWVAWLPWTPGWLIPHLQHSFPDFRLHPSPLSLSLYSHRLNCVGARSSLSGWVFPTRLLPLVTWPDAFFFLVLLIVLFLECSMPEPKRKFYLFNSCNIFFHLNQRSANKGPWAEASDCVFANKVLLEHGHAHLLIYCL